MLAREQWTKPSLESFIAWLETQPKDQAYNWMNERICPCGQYAAAIGVEHWPSKMSHQVPRVWYELNELAYGFPRTFGDLLSRALDLKMKQLEATS